MLLFSTKESPWLSCIFPQINIDKWTTYSYHFVTQDLGSQFRDIKDIFQIPIRPNYQKKSLLKYVQKYFQKQNGPKWPQVAQVGPKWPKVYQTAEVAQNGPKWPNQPKWPKVVQSWPMWPRPSERTWMAQSGPKFPPPVIALKISKYIFLLQIFMKKWWWWSSQYTMKMCKYALQTQCNVQVSCFLHFFLCSVPIDDCFMKPMRWQRQTRQVCCTGRSRIILCVLYLLLFSHSQPGLRWFEEKF